MRTPPALRPKGVGLCAPTDSRLGNNLGDLWSWALAGLLTSEIISDPELMNVSINDLLVNHDKMPTRVSAGYLRAIIKINTEMKKD